MRPSALVVLPVASLLLAGCGGSPSPAAAQHKTITNAPGGKVTTKVPGKQPAGAGAAKSTKAGSHGGASSTGSSSTTGATGSTGAKAPAPGSAQQAARFTAPGKYTFDSKGIATYGGSDHPSTGTATLTVDKPVGDRQHSTLGGDQGGTEQDVVHRADGTYLARLLLNTGGMNKEFKPAVPVLEVPYPASIGRTWSWSMTSTDGKTHAALTAKIVRTETITIGGTSIPTWVVESTLKLTGDFTFDDHQTINYDESRLLQVKERSQGSGSFGVYTFSSDSTSTLRSVRPS